MRQGLSVVRSHSSDQEKEQFWGVLPVLSILPALRPENEVNITHIIFLAVLLSVRHVSILSSNRSGAISGICLVQIRVTRMHASVKLDPHNTNGCGHLRMLMNPMFVIAMFVNPMFVISMFVTVLSVAHNYEHRDYCVRVCTFFLWRHSPTRARAASFLRFLDHTQ